jgi:hypothetical protein
VQEEDWSHDVIPESSLQLLGGRTPLHIACARDDNYRHACRVVNLLLSHHANANLLCNGHSPLALAITSGNDLVSALIPSMPNASLCPLQAVDELLAFGADPCLPLTHGVGSALCVASTTEFEHRRAPNDRLLLVSA